MNGWVNNGEAGDLGRHGAHYDVTVMDLQLSNIPETVNINCISQAVYMIRRGDDI